MLEGNDETNGDVIYYYNVVLTSNETVTKKKNRVQAQFVLHYDSPSRLAGYQVWPK